MDERVEIEKIVEVEKEREGRRKKEDKEGEGELETKSIKAVKERKDKGKVKITERDLRLIRFIAEQYAIDLKQLCQLNKAIEDTEIGESTARRIVDRWQRAGFVESQKIFVKDPVYVWVTRKGLDLVGYDFLKATVPSEATLRHLVAITNMRLKLEEGKKAQFKSERLIRSEAVRVKKGKELPHVPDGEVSMNGVVYPIEIELSVKKLTRIEGIMRELLGRYPTIYYYVVKETKTGVQHALEKLPENLRGRVKINDLL